MKNAKETLSIQLAPRVVINYTDAKGVTTDREVIIVEVMDNKTNALDTSKWALRSFVNSRINSLILK